MVENQNGTQLANTESPFRFIRWLDSQSESTRRIIQGTISGILAASIIGTAVALWGQRNKLADGSKLIWNFLHSPAAFQWLAGLLVALLALLICWVFILLGERRRKERNAILTEIASLRQEVSEYREQDPRYKAALKLINADRGFKFLADHISHKLEKTVLLMLSAKGFDDFVANAGLKLKVDDNLQITLGSMALREAIIFAVASREDPEKQDSAQLLLGAEKTIVLNTAAHMHFDWSFHAFKERIK